MVINLDANNYTIIKIPPLSPSFPTARSGTVYTRWRGWQLYHVRPGHVRRQAEQQPIQPLLAEGNRAGPECQGAERQGVLHWWVSGLAILVRRFLTSLFFLQSHKHPSAVTEWWNRASSATADGRKTARIRAVIRSRGIRGSTRSHAR